MNLAKPKFNSCWLQDLILILHLDVKLESASKYENYLKSEFIFWIWCQFNHQRLCQLVENGLTLKSTQIQAAISITYRSDVWLYVDEISPQRTGGGFDNFLLADLAGKADGGGILKAWACRVQS